MRTPERGMSEAVQRICGSLEVARDLVERAGDLYLAQSSARDHAVIEGLMGAMEALDGVRRALSSSQALASGPAA